MPVMSDRWIRRMAQDKGMIEPFVDAQKRDGIISYGLSSYGYDARVGTDFKIFNGTCGAESGWVPVSAIAPSLLVAEIEVERRASGHERAPILPAPETSPATSPAAGAR